jgi:glycosyltransferase involved in cell wall biosynthesis
MSVERIKLSLVICSHNPRPNYFTRVLAALRDQYLPKACWELIIVDNLSAGPLARNWDLSWHPHGRHVEEPELGLSCARRRGISEASGELLVFVDDDNLLDPHYLTEAIKVGDDCPFLGVWGSGAIVPEYEVEPEERITALLPFLALRDTKAAHWSNFLPCPEATPWGAGLCVRSKVAEAYCNQYEHSNLRISGRQGKKLLSGEDLEISYVANHLGLGMGVFPELRLTHLIPKERVSLDYLLKVYEGTRISNLLLAYKWHGHKPKPMTRTRNLLSIVKTVLLRYGVERQLYFAERRAITVAGTIIASSHSDGLGQRYIRAQIR